MTLIEHVTGDSLCPEAYYFGQCKERTFLFILLRGNSFHKNEGKMVRISILSNSIYTFVPITLTPKLDSSHYCSILFLSPYWISLIPVPVIF